MFTRLLKIVKKETNIAKVKICLQKQEYIQRRTRKVKDYKLRNVVNSGQTLPITEHFFGQRRKISH